MPSCFILQMLNDWMVWGESYASYSCISSLFTSIFHLFASCSCYVRFSCFFLYYFLFASFHRQYVYHDLTVCVFVKHAKPLQIFCRNTILVSLNHTNNVFESIIKTWTHTEHGANNAVLHIIYKMNCTVHCAQCSIAFIFYLLFYSFCRIPPRLALQTELSHQVNMHAVHGNATQSNYVARFSSCDVRNDRAE